MGARTAGLTAAGRRGTVGWAPVGWAPVASVCTCGVPLAGVPAGIALAGIALAGVGPMASYVRGGPYPAGPGPIGETYPVTPGTLAANVAPGGSPTQAYGLRNVICVHPGSGAWVVSAVSGGGGHPATTRCSRAAGPARASAAIRARSVPSVSSGNDATTTSSVRSVGGSRTHRSASPRTDRSPVRSVAGNGMISSIPWNSANVVPAPAVSTVRTSSEPAGAAASSRSNRLRSRPATRGSRASASIARCPAPSSGTTIGNRTSSSGCA